MKTWIFFVFVIIFAGNIFAQEIDEAVSTEDSISTEVTILVRPANLSAKPLNDHTLSLRWQSSEKNISGYILFRKKGDDEFAEISRLETNKAFFVDEELTFNTNYSYKVQCYDEEIKSDFSDEITISTIFPEPSDLSVKPINDQSVTITWHDNCDFETGFIIERKSKDTEYVVIGKIAVDETIYVDEGLIVGEKYYYQVRAESEFNESLASDKITVETEFPAPANFKVIALDDQSVRLTWDDGYEYESGFKIERKTGNDEFEEIAIVDKNSRYFINIELEDGKTYIYIIKAFTEINESRPSASASAELLFPSPQQLYIDVLNDHSAKLYWEDRSTLAHEYILERKVNNEEYEIIIKLDKDERDYLDENMQLGDEYTYRIKALSKVNESEYSNEVGTKTGFPGPENLYSENIDDQSLKLYWEDNCSFETGYRLERKESGGEFEEIADLEPNTTHFLDSNLSFGTTYNYRVIAFTTASESAYSNILSAKTIFPEPTYLSVLILDDQSLKLSWMDNCTFDTGFKIERKKGKEDFVLIKELAASADSYLDEGLKYGTQYIYRIATVTKSNSSNYSSEIMAKTVFPGPSYLSSEILDDRTASIYWEDNCEFETGIKIERRAEDEEFKILVKLPANSTSYTDDNLKFEKTYYYRVQATTSVNNSDFSNVEYLNTIFPHPTNLSAEIVSAGKIKLNWNDNCYFEDGYKIERSQNDSDYRVIKSVKSNITEFIDKDLDYDVEYSYRIHAFTDMNISHNTNTVSEYYGLLVPSDFKISVIADRQVKLAWTDNSNIEEGFKIQRRTENADFKTIANISANSESYTDTDIDIHEKYYYRIYSYINRNNSPESKIYSAICHFGKLRVPEDHPTIQSAINFAVSGDVVIVQPGIYKENINFEGKNITVCSKFQETEDRSYITSTIIDGKSSGSVVNFESEETEEAKLIGFTIQNGTGNGSRGGGIFIYNATPTISDMIIKDNNAEKFGGGFYLYNSNSLIENVKIENNSSLGTKHGYGGGIYLSNSNPILNKLEIIDNKANEFGGGIYVYNSSPELTEIVIAGNEVIGTEYGYGGGIYTQYSTSYWHNLTIADNSAKFGGAIYCNSFSNPKISNSILWNNSPQEVCFHKFGKITMALSYSNIMNAEDGFKTNNNGSLFFKMGVINSDPKFKDAANRNYDLLEESPCIDTGDPAEEYNDADGSRNDMGAK
ncbi:MAG: hypothetical protein KAS53_06775 [Candidatus Cloacimonetes bacterium]|nr:hypothetical protein [Candidatus Cloacimonadota bacterium]